MATRKVFQDPDPKDPELDRLLKSTEGIRVTDAQLREQAVSFAYGSAPLSSRITKESVRGTSQRFRLKE